MRKGIKKGMDYRLQIDELDQVIAPYLHPDFFFLNIGACDGVMGDPVYPLARKYHWRGIAVEPVPYNYERLVENFSSEPQVIAVNAAISSEPQTFWYVEQHDSSPSYIVSQMGSLDRDHLLKNLTHLKILESAGPLKPKPSFFTEYPPAWYEDNDSTDALSVDPDVESYVKGIDIPCYTVMELLKEYSVPSVDYLNIDAEGLDYVIFNMIDFDVIRPSIICIETSSFEVEVSDSLKDALQRENYVFARRFGLYSEVYVQAR